MAQIMEVKSGDAVALERGLPRLAPHLLRLLEERWTRKTGQGYK